MRLALIIAPSDPRSGDLGLRREALAWLRGRLSRFGFHVVIVGGVQDPQSDIDRAIARVSPGDTVLVHASGRLAARDSIAFGATGRIHLGSLTDALVERSPAHVSFVLELTHEEVADDVLLAAEILGEAMAALGAKPRGYPVLAAVRPLAMVVDRVAFTRLALPVASDHAGPPPTEALVSSMYDAASATDESHAVAQSFTFSRGGGSVFPPPVVRRPSSPGVYEPSTPYEPPPASGFAPPAVPAGFDAPEAMAYVGAPDAGYDAAPEVIGYELAPDVTGYEPPPVAREFEPSHVTMRPQAAFTEPVSGEGGDSNWPGSAPPTSGPELSIHSQIAEATEMRDWTRALELRRHRLHVLASPRQKARELVAIARILQAEFADTHGAIDALEMARALDPKPTGVLQALRRGYELLGRWNSVLEVAAALAAITASPAVRSRVEMGCASIALERLSDPDRAVSWLEAALRSDPSNAEAQAALDRLRPPGEPEAESAEVIEARADRLFERGADEAGLAELEAAAAADPVRVSVYEKAFAAHRRAGRTDGALLAALALEELEAADVDQQILIDQFRTVAAVRVRTSLDGAAWSDLYAPGSDDVLTALFAAVEKAAIAARVDELREQRKLVALAPADRLSESSTASIVRTFQWAARVLSVPCPNLYVRDDARDGLAAILAREPSTALGPSVVSGPSAKELAFLAGRHITYYRPGHQVLFYYPGRDELTTLLLAAAQVGMPKAAAQTDDGAVRALRTRIARHIDDEDRAALEKAIRDLDARGDQAALGAWMCSVELTAGRAGLLLSGDLATATAMLRASSSDVANVPLELRRGDLIAFCASQTHAALRRQFVMTAPESLHPAPPSTRLQAAF